MRGYKKRNYLLRDAKEVEEKFRQRNLNDTRYALLALLAELGRQYHKESDGSLRVFARPGELTSKLRQAWGIESLKKGRTASACPTTVTSARRDRAGGHHQQPTAIGDTDQPGGGTHW